MPTEVLAPILTDPGADLPKRGEILGNLPQQPLRAGGVILEQAAGVGEMHLFPEHLEERRAEDRRPVPGPGPRPPTGSDPFGRGPREIPLPGHRAEDAKLVQRQPVELVHA